MLKVLHLSAPNTLAGAERVLLNFLQHYDKSNYLVRVASYLNYQRLDNSFTAELTEQRIPHDRIPIGNTNLLFQVRQTIGIIKHNAIDILHTHGYRSDFKGLISARIAGIPVVSTVHGWTPVSLKLRAYQTLDRYCLKHFDRVLCVSTPLYKEFLQLGVKAERLVYLPNAVDLPEQSPGQRNAFREQLKWTPEEKIVLAIGRLSPEKGLDILLAAYARQFASKRGVRLFLIGDGPQRGELELLAARLGVSEQVFFLGFAANVSKYYAAADLFVMSSYTEGFPMALLEAMAAGLPAIATTVGGIPDILQGDKDGCLIPPGDVDRLAVSMGNLLNNRQLAESMGKTARETIARRFTVQKWARTLEGIYSAVFENRKSN